MISAREVNPEKFNALLKEELKKFKEVSRPEWSYYTKSGVHRQRLPQQEDFWHIRGASILRRLYIDSPVGVGRLKSYFGGKKRRGHKPARFKKASGNALRKILQQLETAGLVENNADRKGRRLTAKGRKLLDKIAHEVSKQ